MNWKSKRVLSNEELASATGGGVFLKGPDGAFIESVTAGAAVGGAAGALAGPLGAGLGAITGASIGMVGTAMGMVGEARDRRRAQAREARARNRK